MSVGAMGPLPASVPGVPLDSVSEAVAESMAANEAALSKALAAAQALEYLDVAHMIKLQCDTANSRLTAQALAAAQKDAADMMKAVIQKIG